MAGDCAAFSATLAADGAVLPLARLLLRSAHASAACTAAWALSNLLWGAPGQVRQVLFSKMHVCMLLNTYLC